MTEKAITNLPRIVGTAGRKYNGKDTIADYLCSKYGYRKLFYAKRLKDICQVMFRFNDTQLYGSVKDKETTDERWGCSPRDALQYIGTELIRKQLHKLVPGVGENFWVRCVEEEIKEIFNSDPTAKIVVSDVRFPNEIDSNRELGFSNLLLRVVRPELNKDTTDMHESEILIDKLNVDEEIINNGTLDELYKKIDDVLEKYSRQNDCIEEITTGMNNLSLSDISNISLPDTLGAHI